MTEKQARWADFQTICEMEDLKMRVMRLTAEVRRGIACIENFVPYVQWDGIDWEEQQTRVSVTLELMREAVEKCGPRKEEEGEDDGL